MADQLHSIWEKLQAEITHTQKCKSEQANKHWSAKPLLRVEAQVFISAENLATDCPCRKLRE
jgi:hypothetical protein